MFAAECLKNYKEGKETKINRIFGSKMPQHLTENLINNTDFKSDVQNFQNTISLKEYNWMFSKKKSMITYVLITEESTGVRSFIKLPLYPTAAKVNI